MGIVDKLLTEDGIFYTFGLVALMFAAWLVVNFREIAPVVFFAYGIILMISIMYRYMEDSPFFESYPLFTKNPMIDIFLGIAFAGVWYFIFLPTPYGVLPLPPLPAEILAVGPAAFLIVVLLAPIAEEYFFRGSVLPQLEEILGNKYNWIIAVLVSSLLFMAFHWTTYVQGALSSALIASAIFGIYVGTITHWRKSIATAIIIHAIINFAIVSPQFALII